jgi:FtsH-binding integral membrane protein
MYYNNQPYGRNNGMFASRYRFEPLQPGMQGVQSGGLVGKVMSLMAFSFFFAFIGTLFGAFIGLSMGTYFVVAIAGLIVLIALNLLIQKPGINLFLLYLFTLLEGMSLSPIIGYYLATNAYILGEAFLITALTTLALAIYSWTTHRDFSRLGDYLFFGLILLLIAGVVGIFFGGVFNTPLVALVISVIGVAIFSGYVLFYVQRAKYMADTLPNAIGITVSLFMTILNLFLYILMILSILQGGGGRRR